MMLLIKITIKLLKFFIIIQVRPDKAYFSISSNLLISSSTISAHIQNVLNLILHIRSWRKVSCSHIVVNRLVWYLIKSEVINIEDFANLHVFKKVQNISIRVNFFENIMGPIFHYWNFLHLPVGKHSSCTLNKT